MDLGLSMEDWGLHKWQMEAWTPSWSGDVEMEVLFEKISEIGNGHWTVGDGARGWKDLDGRDNDGIWKIGDVGWMVETAKQRNCQWRLMRCRWTLPGVAMLYNYSAAQVLLNFYSISTQLLLNFCSTSAQLLLFKMQLHRRVSWFAGVKQ